MNDRRLTLRGYYHATWWALTLLVLTMAAVSTLCPLPVLVLALAVAAPGLTAFARRVPAMIAQVLLLGFAAATLLLGALQYRADGDIVTLVGYALVGMLPIALWRRERGNGNWLALIVCFLISLVSLVLGEEAVEFFLFLLVGVAIVFTLNASHLYFHVGTVESSHATVPRRYFLAFFYSTGVGFFLALGIFLLLPRSVQWVNPLGTRNKEKATTFGNGVSLDGSSIVENQSLALRVESNDLHWLSINGPQFYFRGKTVEHFDGVHWKSVPGLVQRFRNAQSVRFRKDQGSRMRVLRMYREPTSSDALIYPGVLQEIIGPATLRDSLRFDQNGNLFRYMAEPGRYLYDIGVTMPKPNQSALPMPIAKLRAEVLRPDSGLSDPQRYLQIPREVLEKPYFRNWVKELNLDPRRVNLHQVITNLTFEFTGRYKTTYRHDIPSQASFAYFLTRGREGHCEYFATATALVFRYLGIPARIVLGYRGADFNPIANVLEVRESSAHAWVEYFVPHLGWLSFDSTPTTTFKHFSGSFSDYAQAAMSAVNFWLDRYLVRYSGETQRRLAHDIAGLRNSAGEPPHPGWPMWRNAIIALVLGAIGWRFGRRFLRRRRRARRGLPDYYLRFLQIVQQQGHRRQPYETYGAFHRRLIAAGWKAELIDRLDRALQRDLYSREPVESAERRELTRQLAPAA